MRLCNFSEWYHKKKNECLPCGGLDAASFTLGINYDTCYKCSDILDNSLRSQISPSAHNRVEFLCRNSDVYTLQTSSRTDQNFFEIGSEIPPLEFAKEIRIAGISDDPDSESDANGSGNDGSENVI